MNEKILVVDDIEDIRNLLQEALQANGYHTLEAADGREALSMIETKSPDLVVLDIAMPVMSGFQVLRQLRKNSDIPVIMLSARTDTVDKVESLELGADDYITKPFEIAEMTARVEAVLRRRKTISNVINKVEFNDGQLLIDLAKRRVTLKGEEVELTPKEYELLRELVLNTGTVLEYQQILNAVWGKEYGNAKELVQVTLKRLRAKIEVDPGNPKYVLTISGVGYRFKEIS
jgi:DNA-binding response OmpR family regulator